MSVHLLLKREGLQQGVYVGLRFKRRSGILPIFDEVN